MVIPFFVSIWATTRVAPTIIPFVGATHGRPASYLTLLYLYTDYTDKH